MATKKQTTIELLQLATTIGKVQTLVDGGLKLDVVTQELTPADATKVFDLKGKLGYMVFKATRISEDDVANLPEEVKEFKDDKSPSKRLRAVIYLFWKKESSQKEVFDAFYRRHLEKIIEQYKEKL